MKKILTILFLLTCTLIKTARADQYSKHWILKTNEDAHKLAEQNNFRIIRSFTLDNQNYHIAQPDYHRLKRSTDDSHEHLDDLIKQSEKRILSDPSVSLFEREKILKRTKRDYVAPPQSVSTLSEHQKELAKQQLQQGLLERIHREYYMQSGLRPNLKRLAPIQDPMWSEMWYLNRHSSGRDLPDMNVTGAWSQGYSGRGVSVTFLDDGLEHDHPDIQQNYDPKASDDINDNDSDPMPRYDDSNENKHGTRCAGEVAAVANNSICSVGVAFNAGIGGIRMLDGDVTDSVEARSLSFNRDHIDIYSASWGPDDNGEVVDGPGPLAKQAFIEGVTQGRKGLGSIFVWASGNGGRFSDSCSCDGYANSIYTLSISSTSENSEKPWYLEECTSTLATTYSSGDERMNEREVVTTDLRHQCTKKHTGTSAAAPIAAGIVALALEANSKLTWRDVMYLIVLSSRPKAIKSNNFIINKRGFMVSSRYGFGLMDAGRMVELAKNWQNVPLLRTCQTLNSVFKVKSVQKQDAIEATLTTDACLEADQEVNFIEQVEIVVTIQAPVRGNLEIYLTSPMGTFAQILPKRPKDQSNEGFKRWSFMTVQLWGEMPRGDWKLLVASTDQTVRLEEFFLNIHGTKEKPIEYENLINMKSVICHYECSQISGLSCGPTEYDCFQCAHYSLEIEPTKIKCVSYCPYGYYADDTLKKCSKCDSECLECKGNSSLDCTKCNDNHAIDYLTHVCQDSCSDGYFINHQSECEQCGIMCKTCKNEADVCLSCFDNYKLVNNKCVPVKQNECESGSYLDVAINECKLCDIACGECLDSANSCTTCTSLEKRPYLKHEMCVASCGDGYFLDQSLNMCSKCNSYCLTCELNAFRCTKCKPGFKLNQYFECVQDLLKESECSADCLECYRSNDASDPIKCLTCKNEHGLLDGKCYETSPHHGYFKNKLKTYQGIKYEFQKCKPFCVNCTDSQSCYKCEDGFSLSNDECIKTCDPTFYSNEFGGCSACKSPCDKCSNETYCLSCQSGLSVLNGECIASCPQGYYTKNAQCLQCYPTCETCNGPLKTDCIDCVAGSKKQNYECKSSCPDGSYYENLTQECTACNTNNCSLCVRTPSTCIKCFSPLVLDQTSYTCKQCCTRSIHGKLKVNSCCNCPEEYTGFCASRQESNFNSYVFGIVLRKETTNKITVAFSVIFIIVSCFILICSIVILGRSCKKDVTKYSSVRYSVLDRS